MTVASIWVIYNEEPGERTTQKVAIRLEALQEVWKRWIGGARRLGKSSVE